MKQKSAVEIIDEVCQFYLSNPDQRAMASRFDCVYITEDGRKCAVGRCMIAPEKLSAYQNSRAFNSLGTTNEERDEFLKPEYRGHDIELWRLLQMWHDDAMEWEAPDGIENRREVYLRLREQYNTASS